MPTLPTFSHPHTVLALSHPGVAVGFWQPQHCSGITWLSQPRAPQPHPCVLPCSGMGQAWDKAWDRRGTSFPRGDLGVPNSSHSTFRVSLHAHANTRSSFQELRSFFISAWRYPHNFRKYIESSASTDLILICGLGFFFSCQNSSGGCNAQIRMRRQKGQCIPVHFFFFFWLLISRSEK